MSDKVYNVLFLCTGNSARSILGEALMNRMGDGQFAAYSAGSQPKGDVHPMAIEVLGNFGYPTDGLHSRSEEHTSDLQSLMRISYAVFCLKQKKNTYSKTQQL